MIQTHTWRQSKQEAEMPSLAQYKLFEASIFGVFLMMLNFNSYSIKHLAITCSVFLRMIHQPEASRRINIGWMTHCIGNRICNQTFVPELCKRETVRVLGTMSRKAKWPRLLACVVVGYCCIPWIMRQAGAMRFGLQVTCTILDQSPIILICNSVKQ